MKAILFDQPGGPEALRLGEAPEPVCGEGEVLIAVRATAANRADIMQRRGLYPPPPGASSILGLEAAGHVAGFGPGKSADGVSATGEPLRLGQPVMALLSGGGYAERVTVPGGQVMSIPSGLALEQAAAIPEVFLTAFLNLFYLGGLSFSSGAVPDRRKSVLIHGGTSGVGSAALQLCHAAGVDAYCTVGDDKRAADCQRLGARLAWNYKTTDWVAAIESETVGRGVDVVLDCIGASYLDRNLRVLALDGRLICIGLLGGSRAELDLGLLLRRRVQVIGSTLRALPRERKAALCREFAAQVLPRFETGELRPVIDRVLPLAQAADAHRALDEPHVGKIVLLV
jgi:putative PIG3 family NAD(P)H quinone oxidoreductase